MITKPKLFIDFYRFAQQPQTDVTQSHLSDHSVFLTQRIYICPVARVLELPTCPPLALGVTTAQEEDLLNIRCIIEGYHLLREVLDGMNVTYRKNEKRNTVGEESQRDPSQSMPPRIVIAVQNILYNRAGKHQN